MPICQISLLRQSGHQLRPISRIVGRPVPAAPAPRRATVIAINTSGMPQSARLKRQDPSTSGNTSGIVSITGSGFADQQPVGTERGAKAHPVRQPLANERRQRRLHDRDAGTHQDGGCIERQGHRAPRRAGPTPSRRSAIPPTSVGSAPKRAISSDPGSAAMPNRITGKPDRMPTSVPDRPRSLWMRRNDRRHRQDGQPQPHAREPQQARCSPEIRAWRLPEAACTVLVWQRNDSLPSFGEDAPAYSTLSSRSSASLILARRISASSRFSRSPSTTSSGARRHEIGIGQLGVDAGDVGAGARHFLFEPRILGRKIDHAL